MRFVLAGLSVVVVAIIALMGLDWDKSASSAGEPKPRRRMGCADRMRWLVRCEIELRVGMIGTGGECSDLVPHLANHQFWIVADLFTGRTLLLAWRGWQHRRSSTTVTQ